MTKPHEIGASPWRLFLPQKYAAKNALSSLWASNFPMPPLLKAFFKNIKANNEIRIGKYNSSFWESNQYSVISYIFFMHPCPACFCKEISISILYNIIIYIDITSLASFSVFKEIGWLLSTEYQMHKIQYRNMLAITPP